jgi:hypothetical protein
MMETWLQAKVVARNLALKCDEAVGSEDVLDEL